MTRLIRSRLGLDRPACPAIQAKCEQSFASTHKGKSACLHSPEALEGYCGGRHTDDIIGTGVVGIRGRHPGDDAIVTSNRTPWLQGWYRICPNDLNR